MNYSVLMSIYIEEDVNYFIDSLESMLNQTILPDEIVIVKDGPLTEELNNVIKEYSSNYPELFNIVSLKNNVGLGLALNEGLNACKNELVARMDTDDISLPERCEKQLNVFRDNPNLSIVGSNVDEFFDDPSKIISSRVVPSSHEDILNFSKRRSPFNHPTVMYKKTDVLSVGGYGNYRRNQDYQLFVRMLNEGYKAMNINESLLLFRANEDNVKRRKSWHKTKSEISIRYNFWKEGYTDLGSLVVTTVGFLAAFIMPDKIFELISLKVLRKQK